MSGHSKWNNIKRKKEATDAAKGKIFTKIGREITVVVREGGPDPANNAKLRDLIAKAKANNVPNDNIDRVIKKAAGGEDKNNYENLTYEGYGPNGRTSHTRDTVLTALLLSLSASLTTRTVQQAISATISINSAAISVLQAAYRSCSPRRAS